MKQIIKEVEIQMQLLVLEWLTSFDPAGTKFSLTFFLLSSSLPQSLYEHTWKQAEMVEGNVRDYVSLGEGSNDNDHNNSNGSHGS